MFLKRILTARETRKNQKAETARTRYTYLDCLRDEVPVPTGANWSTYQLLMAGCTTLFMFIVTCLARSGTGYFTYTH